MKELGQLDAQHDEFAKRKVRIVAISNDSLGDAKATQDRFPNLLIVADPLQTMAKAVEVIHQGAAAGGGDTNAPTTFLVDSGYVRWFFRPDSFIARLSPQELLAAIDQTWK